MATRRSNTRVLIVEDDRDTREMYRLALMRPGYSVSAVEDGLDALRRIEAETPDVVVLDLMLPRLGGEDVFQELRAHPETHDIPVVIVTGSDVRHLDSSENQYFLRKPVSADTLVSTIDRATASHAIRIPEGV